MGGRGTFSMTFGDKPERVKLLGKDTNAHPKNMGGPVDSRESVRTLARNVGFVDVIGTDEIMTQSMGAYTKKIGELERKYGALKAVPTTLAGADGSGFMAAAGSYGGNGAVMVLNRSSMKNAAKQARTQSGLEKSGHSMRSDGKLTSRANYTVTHEYGHLVQNALYQKAVMGGYNGTRQKFESDAKRQIEDIAIKKYKSKASHMSDYGRSNAAEFFAEAFAGANSGKPNSYGKAMLDYLKQNKLK